MQLGPFTLPNALFVAPMAGVTDRPFRKLCKRLGAGYAVSEMVTSRPDLQDSLKTSRRANHEGEAAPIAVQIAGTDAQMMADGARYNVNADTAAGALASALKASRLILMTDVAGVLDKQKQLIREIPAAQVELLIKDGTAVGGMIPKLETAAQSVNHGVGAAVILDGRAPHALLMELFTEHGAGTLVS